MASSKGVAFVLLAALLQPSYIALRVLLNPLYLTETSKTFLLLSALFWIAVLRIITIPYFTSPLRHLPQPAGEGFITAHGGADFEKPRGSKYRTWIDTIPNAGLIFFRTFFHSFSGLLLTSPEALHDVLVTNSYDFEKPAPGRALLARTIGNGLINTEGAEHKFQRKGVTPAFSGKHIRELVPIFWRKSVQLFDHIAETQLDQQPSSTADDNATREEKKKDGGGGQRWTGRSGVVEINQWASRVTLDIIGLACVGRDFGSIRNSDDDFVQQYEKILRTDDVVPVAYAICTILIPLWIGRWTPFWRRFRDASDGRYRLRQLCDELIERKRLDMKTEDSKHIDILSVLIRNGQFSDKQLVSQLLTFLAAGHETTSGALTWTSWLLATHPEVQTKLRAELRTFFSTAGADATLDAAALENLPYLHAVTSEQLRLWPSVPNTGRVTVRDTTVLGQRVPKNTMIIISPWAINRSTKLWGADAGKFVPERWIDDNSNGNPEEQQQQAKKRSQYGGATNGGALSLITFLHGPRSCIGQSFSRLELKCLVAAMVRKFSIEMADPTEKIEPGGFITIKPKDGMRLRLRELSS